MEGKHGMSRAILTEILNEMKIFLNDFEAERLYRELLYYFGLIGASDECQALEAAWKDPYNKREIEEFIKTWLKRKQTKKEEAIAGIV